MLELAGTYSRTISRILATIGDRFGSLNVLLTDVLRIFAASFHLGLVVGFWERFFLASELRHRAIAGEIELHKGLADPLLQVIQPQSNQLPWDDSEVPRA